MHFRNLAVGAAMLAGAAFAPELAAAAALPGAQGSQSSAASESVVEEVRRRGGRHGHRHRGHRHFGHHHRRHHFHGHRHRHFGHRHHRHRHFRHRHFYGYAPYYGGRCVHVRHRCAEYWGWGTYEFYRCIRNRGC